MTLACRIRAFFWPITHRLAEWLAEASTCRRCKNCGRCRYHGEPCAGSPEEMPF